MYLGQAAAGLAVAGGTGYALLSSDQPLAIVFSAASVAYIAVRWLLAWGFRIKYWYSRGTQGHYTTSCPECGQYIYRQSHDWILMCKRCGWRAGWPGVRWVIQSVPARQLRRTVVGGKLVVLVGALIVIATYPMITVGSLGTVDSIAGVQTADTEPGASTAKTPTNERLGAGYNVSKVESEFISLLNQERQSRSLQEVSQRDVLSEMGQSHARVIADIHEITHVQPDGTTIADRYQQRGLLPECRLPIQGTDQFYRGAENVYQGYVDTEVFQADGGIISVNDEEDLAQDMFESWMNSKPHREAMLVYSADQAGLGVARVDESDAVYVALELC